MCDHLRQTLVVGGGRGEAHKGQTLAFQRRAKLGVFLRRDVHADHPVRASSRRVRGKLFKAIGEERIGVAHQHDGRVLVGLAEAFDEREHALERHAALKRADRGALDGRAVRHGIGEGHAKFQHVRALVGEALHHLQRGVRIGIPRHDIGDEACAVVRFQGGEGGGEAGHGLTAPHRALRRRRTRPCRRGRTYSSG